MGHDTHFLERLERLSAHHAEWALYIYRDPELVRLLLTAAKIPDNAQRIALSLDHPTDGPFVVVQRDGVFVTCLGVGMSTGSCPIIPRHILDAQVQRLDVLRTRKAVFEERLERHGSLVKLMKRIWEAGHRVSREEFVAASTMSPLIRDELWRQNLELTEKYIFLVQRLTAGQFDRRFARPTDHDLHDMRVLWNWAWRVGHNHTLASIDGVSTPMIETLVEQHPIDFDPTWTAVRIGLLSTVARSAWAVAQHGKLFLWGAKQRMTRALEAPSRYYSAMVCLLAIGVRHPKLQGEIAKAFEKCSLDKVPLNDQQKEIQMFSVKYVKTFMRLPPNALEEVLEEQRSYIHTYWPGIQEVFATPKDIPMDLMPTLLANQQDNLYSYDSYGGIPLMGSLPHCVRQGAELLYFTEKDIARFTTPWTPVMTIEALLLPFVDRYGVKRPVVNAQKKVGRNEQCPCNSGKKYKTCCLK
ncbi:MAG: SEC-C domain-containing protein [Myxococcales bacterium]|nr:SEC-C domain-containing protein [Myxococcales bacterium]